MGTEPVVPDAPSGDETLAQVFAAVTLVTVLFWLAMVLAALVREKGWEDKLLWAAIILFTPPVGAIFYLTIWIAAPKAKAGAGPGKGAEESPPASSGRETSG